MVRRNTYYTTKTMINGQQVELEEIFDYLEKDNQDPEKTFKSMISSLKEIDVNIEDKIESLKFKLSQERPDEFDYIADNDWRPSGVKRKPEPPSCRVESTGIFDIFNEKHFKLFLIVLFSLIILTITVSILATIQTKSTEEPPKHSIRIEKLDPL